jgi:DNA-binding GntR family transcriptional regulator
MPANSDRFPTPAHSGDQDVTRGKPTDAVIEATGLPAAASPAVIGPIGRGASDNARQLGDAVADTIVDAIALGTLRFGQRIIEIELANQLEVSRVPIREAIKILHSQGILTAAPNRGARVAPFDGDTIDQVFEVRVVLERIAARDAMGAYRRDPRLLDGLREIMYRMERMARWSDWVEFRRCDVAFHREICRASGNDVVLKLWEALARHVTIIFGRELASERDFQVVISQHRKLLTLFERGDAQIERIIEDHIVRLRPPARQTTATPGSKSVAARR